MKILTDKKLLVILLFAGFLTTSCATYYKVGDPVTGNLYYTEKVDRQGSAAMFKDARSGQEVTIQNSEIREISKDEFKAGIKAPKAQGK